MIQEYPEVADILAETGLKDVKNPAVLETVAKQLTIPQGTKQRGFATGAVIKALKDHGFEVLE